MATAQSRRMPPEVRARIEMFRKVRQQEEMIKKRLSNIRYKIAILSGKGGVGKSFITASLAFALALKGRRVGILDADIHGPSIPKMAGVQGKNLSATTEGAIIPVEAPLGVKIVSIALMLPTEDTPIIWRGPIKTSAIRELLAYTEWGSLDYLLIDLPPGTGDEQLTIVQLVRDLTGLVIVTTPSEVARSVVVKAVMFARKLNTRVIGLVENMSYFRCPNGEKYYVFGRGGGKRISKEYGIRFLGEVPLDPLISAANDEGEPFIIKYSETETAKTLMEIASKVVEEVER